jgi:hypothetical protein
MEDILKAPNSLKLEDLARMYLEGYECDKRMFSEMRTNLQLLAGQHYLREGSRYWNRIRSTRKLSYEQKLKLTKNHIQKITKVYRDNIETYAPGVAFEAANPKELSDQKSAQMVDSYWSYVDEQSGFNEFVHTTIKNFVEIGECCCKVFWSMDGGQIVGYEAEMEEDEDGNQTPKKDENDLLIPSDTPVYGGKLKFEIFEAYNLRRDPAASSMKDSPYVTYTKLLPKRKVASLTKDDEMKQKLLHDMPVQEYSVYDNNTGSYRTEKNQVVIKETYFRPAPAIPNGYYYIWTDSFKITEGELPYGIFPIIHEGFDEQTGNA